MSRILHHVGRNDFKKTRQRQISENKERAAQKLKELQEVEAERKIIEEAAKPFKSDWRLDFLSEAMTTAGLGMLNLDGEPDVIQSSIPDATISSADNLGEPDGGVVPRIQYTQVIDASKTDTITLNISGTFGSKAPSRFGGTVVTDKVSVGVLVNGTYADNYLAQELGSGTHTISIPKRFQTANVRFDVLQVHAFEGEGGYQSGPVSITGIGLKRLYPMNVFVPLDDPEANSFIRGGLGGSEERRAKLKDMLESGNEWMTMLGLESSKTSPGDIEIASADALNTPGGVQGTAKDYTYDPHMKTYVPNISDVEKRAAGRQTKFRREY